MMTVLIWLSILVLVFIGFVSLRVAFVFLFMPERTYREIKGHVPEKVGNIVTGKVQTYRFDGNRDFAVSAGMAVDKEGRLVPQGRLAQDYLEQLG